MIKVKSKIGPGGVKCPCCQVGTKAESKVHYNQAIRRAAKADIKKQINEG